MSNSGNDTSLFNFLFHWKTFFRHCDLLARQNFISNSQQNITVFYKQLDLIAKIF